MMGSVDAEHALDSTKLGCALKWTDTLKDRRMLSARSGNLIESAS